MPPRKFKFGAQPALDKALARQQECEEALAAAKKAVEAEKRKLEQIRLEIEEIRQQTAAEHDKLLTQAHGGVTAAALSGRNFYIAALQTKEKQRLAALAEQQKQVRWAEQKVVVRKDELAEAMGAVKALEKFKEKKKAEHEAALRKAEERERDDIANLYRRNKPG